MLVNNLIGILKKKKKILFTRDLIRSTGCNTNETSRSKAADHGTNRQIGMSEQELTVRRRGQIQNGPEKQSNPSEKVVEAAKKKKKAIRRKENQNAGIQNL